MKPHLEVDTHTDSIYECFIKNEQKFGLPARAVFAHQDRHPRQSTKTVEGLLLLPTIPRPVLMRASHVGVYEVLSWQAEWLDIARFLYGQYALESAVTPDLEGKRFGDLEVWRQDRLVLVRLTTSIIRPSMGDEEVEYIKSVWFGSRT